MHLMDRVDEEGNTIKGRYDTPPIRALFGEGAFDSAFSSPWEGVLTNSRPDGDIATGLHQAWSHLTSKFQEVATPEQMGDTENYLINQPIERAGFCADGSVKRSVTNAVTEELEKQRSSSLGTKIQETLGRDDYEKWAWDGSTRMSSTFLSSPPDAIGYLGDNVFQVVLTTYLGQPCPMMAPLVGRFFGKSGEKVDKYGANLAAAALPGQGHSALHNQIQSLVQSVMKVAGVHSEKEAVNFLLGKVGEPHINAYINHVARGEGGRRAMHAIIPDAHATNFPAGKQTVNDSGAKRDAEAFFEIKTMTACKSRYGHNNNRMDPVDRRAKLVVQSYSRKFKKLDKKFAADVVGDGNSGTVGPFEAAQKQFFRGQVIPLCAGWFGETNEDFEKVIRTLAKEAAAGQDGMAVSPLINTDRKGGAFPIMLHQFRRAIGVAIVRGNANHKLGRMHYVRGSPEEAANTCRANHSDHRYKPSEREGPSWYNEHTQEGYRSFQQFKNGHDFCMP